jgi:uncharacterized protein (DUF885 family)
MTTETDLLPQPEPGMLHVGEPREWFTADQMHAYARANVAHAAAPLQAEIETLLAELDIRDSIIATHAADTREYQKRISQAEARAALAQQPAAVDEAMVERIAALLHEEATAEPWTVAGVEHPGPDRDYYRGLARKVATIAAQQPAVEDWGLKTCYQCNRPVTWLAPDSRCVDCTRLTPDEVGG